MPSTERPPLAIHGTLIHTPSPASLSIHPSTLLLIAPSGLIHSIHPCTPPSSIPSLLSSAFPTSTSTPTTLILSPSEFLLPGFIDTHTHAPQFPQRGTGRGIDLLTWLNDITFPTEARYQSLAYAETQYPRCVEAALNQGITTASYYASIHVDACSVLARTCLEKGQRALVGRVAMNRESTCPAWYRDGSAEEAVRLSEESIARIRALDEEYSSRHSHDHDIDNSDNDTGLPPLVQPIITPRFAISCDEQTLAGLGRLASRPENRDLLVQTHFNESRAEKATTRELFRSLFNQDQNTNETTLYSHFDLLPQGRAVLAHAIYPEGLGEIAQMQALDVGVAHCPIANTTMDEFMVAPVREYLRRGMKVGLGTDCGGGYAVSMLEVMRSAFVVSVARKTETGGRDEPISVAEGLWMATRGGAMVLGLGERVGCFEVGMEFDALVVRMEKDGHGHGQGVASGPEEGDDVETVLERFVMTGDDRNIRRVFVRGREVKRVDED